MKLYLESFDLLGEDLENKFFENLKMTCYNNFYPFQTLKKDFKRIEFEPITIFYGGNGSGKSTVLNIIAEMLEVKRSVKFNKSSFFEDYVDMCGVNMVSKPPITKILTSDDVFKNLFLLREKNEIIDEQRSAEFEKRRIYRNSGLTAKELMEGDTFIDNLDKLRDINASRSKTASAYVKSRVSKNLIGKSNGETALDFFVNELSEPGLYLLDEPENSLSVPFQSELAIHLAESARFFGAQMIIATHSPFVLSIPNAKIYNLDDDPVSVTYDWTTLENMKKYYSFFSKYKNRFEK